MFRNKRTFNESTDMIQENIKNKESFLVVCDEDLKEKLAEYLFDTYGLVDTKEETDCDEYYISLVWFNDESNFSIQDAKCSCEYKIHDIGGCDYYICIDINSELASEKFIGDKMFCELIDCDYCDYEDNKPELDYLIDKTKELLQNDFCPDCGFDFLNDIFQTAWRLGFDECRLKMESNLENLNDGLLP